MTTKNAILPVKRVYSVNTYSRISTVLRGSERSEWASPWTERASEASGAKRIKAEHCIASQRSEQCERTNIASDWVACTKRVCLWLETPPNSVINNSWKKSLRELISSAEIWYQWNLNHVWLLGINFWIDSWGHDMTVMNYVATFFQWHAWGKKI